MGPRPATPSLTVGGDGMKYVDIGIRVLLIEEMTGEEQEGLVEEIRLAVTDRLDWVDKIHHQHVTIMDQGEENMDTCYVGTPEELV